MNDVGQSVDTRQISLTKVRIHCAVRTTGPNVKTPATTSVNVKKCQRSIV